MLINHIPEYLQLKYEVPNNISLVFSFEDRKLYSPKYVVDFITTLELEDIPIEWFNFANEASIELKELKEFVQHPSIVLKFPTYGEIEFW
jgi:hypothetical protein